MIRKILFGGDGDANPGLLFLRLFTGAAMMTHGIPKLFGGMEAFTQVVGNLPLPAPAVMAFLAALSESFGALFLMLGLLTRPAAALLACTMGVAAFLAHGGDPFATRELALLYFFIALFFLLKGAGRWSVDRFLRRAR